MLQLIAQAQDAFGTVAPPPGVDRFSGAGSGQIGILTFFSAIFNLATVLAGLWVLLNLVLAGYQYITSQGDSSAHGKVRDMVTNSIIGLIIIAVAYTIVALLGLLFFGSASYFINPTLITPQAPAAPGVII